MQLTLHERERLMIYTAAKLAEERRADLFGAERVAVQGFARQ